jgi:hypothetical protein
MANCSIPNSSPASGRISTRSLRRSRRQNSEAIACTFVNRGWWLDLRKRRQAAILQSALRARKIRRRTLDSLPRFSFYGVERWEFSAIGRVKGAWWPSRSSKPPSPRKWRGRFDSYPLREFESVPVAVSLCETRACPQGDGYSSYNGKGGEPHVA